MHLNDVLKELNSILILKPHMVMEKILFEDYENIRILNKTVDFQELLLISDALISDYSGAWIDYLLTLKPIVLFPYDINKYSKQKGLNYDLEEIAPGPIVCKVDGLVEAIRNIDIIDKDYKQKREKIRDRFNKYKDGKSTERLLNFLGIKYSKSI
jgi:CDP-glycerol glycerophosphotransferase